MEVSKLKKAWCAETCYPKWKNDWSSEKPEYGQCAVTSLLVQDELGGNIVFNKKLNHYWNILPDGSNYDITMSQFDIEINPTPDKTVDRSEFGKDVIKRYNLLKERYGK